MGKASVRLSISCPRLEKPTSEILGLKTDLNQTKPNLKSLEKSRIRKFNSRNVEIFIYYW